MKLPLIQEFKCNQCGTCCSHIRGMMPREDKEFIQDMAFGKLPLVQLVPVERMSFTLWDWEAQRFKEWAEEKNFDAKIKPLRGILDLNTNTAITASYFMDAEACPFLKENKCSIYDKKRAYICRFFPFNRGPFLETGTKVTKDQLFGDCQGMEAVFPHIPEQGDEMIQYLTKAFPDNSFENAIQFDYIQEWVNKTIIDLMRKKLIRPAINYPYDMFVKRFNNADQIDFTDFLEEIGYVDKKEALIGRFDHNQDAKALLKDFLSSS